MGLLLSLCPQLLLLSAPALADKVAPPLSYATHSADGRMVFVMLSPGKRIDEEFADYPGGEEAASLRERYAASGLYVNDGSTRPLWSVDWYAWRVLVPSDGVHLVRLGPWAHSLSDEALTFFANGHAIKSYRVSDFVLTDRGLPHSVSHFEWESSVELHEAAGVVTVVTLDGDVYRMDFRTGAIVSSDRPIVNRIFAALHEAARYPAPFLLLATLLLIASLLIGRAARGGRAASSR